MAERESYNIDFITDTDEVTTCPASAQENQGFAPKSRIPSTAVGGYFKSSLVGLNPE